MARSQEYGVNEASADTTAAYWAVGNEFTCWYNPDNYNEVLFSIGYTTWKWVLTAFPTAFLLLTCIAATYPFIYDCWRRNLDYYPRARPILLNTGPLWCGTIVPLGMFLPISYAPNIPDGSRFGLRVTVLIFIVVFWTVGPYLICGIITIIITKTPCIHSFIHPFSLISSSLLCIAVVELISVASSISISIIKYHMCI
jgi:hypothetical protein